MQIYEALRKDHVKVKELMDRLVSLSEGQEDLAKELTAQVEAELIPHARAEESVFYNSLRSIDAAKDLVWHGYEEHMEAEALLRTLQAANAVDADFRTTARKLRSALNHHIEEEEGKIFNAAHQLLTMEEAEMMGEAFEEMKPEVRSGSVLQSTLDLVANMMPVRFAAPLRTFTLHPH